MKKIKEWFRKRMVSLKRNPNYIPLVMLCISCIVFNLCLTNYSNTIALINEPGMGICSFVIVLCSFLSIITFLTAFPKRKKVKIGSIIVVLTMLIISICSQGVFHYFIRYGTVIKENPIPITETRKFITSTSNMCIIHIILLSITFLLIVFLPLYRKLLQKINTNVKIEENDINKIELSNDEL